MQVHRRSIWFVFEKDTSKALSAVMWKFLESFAAENRPAANDPQLFDLILGPVVSRLALSVPYG